ncbi:uncharacterized protein N7479_003396 [Penicillium vulpinum]|uniref:Uncharacterized protein n=1 Tax=Penicillium vulpinum TaxID=29845 RepID=A0A1V6RE30_9EURO|nr:uncharacterized protein N7479_003396 [Penicillium vulpinum]KAJ5963520.1 hypothetical protein N7479_003396 [Penicillium vulpinum]OQE00065.1 hypothetical protein PENVUL_c059G07921 [Penicillium vulpinum]
MQPAEKPTQSKTVLTLPREKTQDEIKLEQSGDIDALQRYRRNVIRQEEYLYTDRALKLLRIEEDLRSTVQEEQILAKKPETTDIGYWNDSGGKSEAHLWRDR